MAESLGLEPRHRFTDYCPLSKRVPYQLGLRLHKQDTLLGFEPIHNFVSKNYLYSSFSSYYNCTVNEYIIQRKISVAKTMLIETKNTAFDIAKALGFDNYSYFCKLFKKHTGLSPLKYRK